MLWNVVQAFVFLQLMLLRRRPVRGGDASHRHVGTVGKEDEDGEQTDRGAHHAETNDASTAQVQTLHYVATQEGSTSSCRYHHVP